MVGKVVVHTVRSGARCNQSRLHSARRNLGVGGIVPSWRRGNLVAKTARRDDCKKPTADGGGSDDDRWHPEVHALAEGRESTLTVSEGAAAVDRALGRSRHGKPGGGVIFRVRQVLVEWSQKLAGPDKPASRAGHVF